MRELNKHILKLLLIVMLLMSLLVFLNVLYVHELLREIHPKLELLKRSTFSVGEVSSVKDPGEKKDWKVIAFFTPFIFHNNFTLWKKVFKRLLSGDCEESRCQLVFDKKFYDQADAVIFNGDNLRSKVDRSHKRFFPSRKKLDQLFVYFSFEAPLSIFRRIKLSDYDNFFNWTMTYRKDSDVYMPYGQVLKRNNKAEVMYVTDEELRNKKMAFWMASRCSTPSRREQFVKRLGKYIQIDIYGACGTKECGSKHGVTHNNILDDDPCTTLAQNYSFYLALENSHCQDYVTEKLYRSLTLGIIPVVYGAANYRSIAPPRSFIDSNDFESVEKLGEYLTKVSKNATLYNKYLKWKEDYFIDLGSPYRPLVCDLCKKLHEEKAGRSRQAYPSIKKWLVNDGKC